jgi:hypothetical protein
MQDNYPNPAFTLMSTKLAPRIFLESTGSTTEILAVRAVFGRLGMADAVSPTEILASGEPDLWVVIIQTPLGLLLASLSAGFLSEAGKDLYRELKALIQELWATRRTHTGDNGDVLLRLAEGSYVRLDENLPDEAYVALDALDHREEHSLNGIFLMYDRDAAAWRTVWEVANERATGNKPRAGGNA